MKTPTPPPWVSMFPPAEAAWRAGYEEGHRAALQQVTTVQEQFPLVDAPDSQMSFLS